MLLCVLILTSCLMVRPVRTWIEQSAVEMALGPGYSVAQVHIYPRPGVVEIKELTWKNCAGPSALSVKVPRAWFSPSEGWWKEPQLHVRKAVLRDAELRLEVRPSNISTVNVWERALEKTGAQLNWRQLNSRLVSIRESERVVQTWAERIDRWSQRAIQVAHEAESLSRAESPGENLLRQEEQLRSLVAQVNALLQEQLVIVDQFDNVQKLLHAESKRLADLHDQDLGTIERLAGEIPSAETDLGFEHHLAIELANECWLHYRPFAMASMLGSEIGGFVPIQRSAPGVGTRRTRIAHIAALKADGQFCVGATSHPFHCTGKWSKWQDIDRQLSVDYSHRFVFPAPEGVIQVTTEATSRRPGLRHIQLVFQPHAPLATAHATHLDLLASTDGAEVSGELCLEPASMARLHSGLASDTLAVTKVPAPEAPQALRMSLAGDWTTPKFSCDGDLPGWVRTAAIQLSHDSLNESLVTAKAKLIVGFQHQARQLTQLGELAERQSSELSAAYHRDLLAARQRLQNQLEQLDGVEFARRADRTQR